MHRRLCAPSLVRHGAFDVASEIFAVRHLPGDFFSVEETREGLVLALGDIGGKGLAAGMWVTHLIGLIRTHTAANSDPEAIVAGVNRDIARLIVGGAVEHDVCGAARFDVQDPRLL